MPPPPPRQLQLCVRQRQSPSFCSSRHIHILVTNNYLVFLFIMDITFMVDSDVDDGDDGVYQSWNW